MGESYSTYEGSTHMVSVSPTRILAAILILVSSTACARGELPLSTAGAGCPEETVSVHELRTVTFSRFVTRKRRRLVCRIKPKSTFYGGKTFRSITFEGTARGAERQGGLVFVGRGRHPLRVRQGKWRHTIRKIHMSASQDWIHIHLSGAGGEVRVLKVMFD
jgi:hypothetical protein